MQSNKLVEASSDPSKPIEKCVICQDALHDDVAKLSDCTHTFHKDCIESWASV